MIGGMFGFGGLFGLADSSEWERAWRMLRNHRAFIQARPYIKQAYSESGGLVCTSNPSHSPRTRMPASCSFCPRLHIPPGRNSTLVLDYLHHCWRRSTNIAVLMPPNLVRTRTLRLDPTTREERENAGSILLAGSSDARALVPVERAAVR